MTDSATTSTFASDDTVTATDADIAIASSTGSRHHNQNIFTERVARALAVRTDTTAMKTALDALSQLQQQQQQQQMQLTQSSASSELQELGRIITSTSMIGGSNHHVTSSNINGSQMMMIDSRSVRTVMEYDALQQAMAVQESVEELLQMITQLHDHCQSIVTTAQLIRATIHDDASSTIGETDNEEYQIATRINSTIQQRDVIQTQVQTLQLFVQQYNLSDHDVYLLDHYNSFDENSTSGSTAPIINHSNQDGSSAGSNHANDGIAFLQALQRIRQIRLALQEKFGTSSTTATTSNISSTHDVYAMLDTGTTASSNAATTTTALQLMERLSVQQENAYERLYHWLQQYLQRSSNSSGSDIARDDIVSGGRQPSK